MQKGIGKITEFLPQWILKHGDKRSDCGDGDGDGDDDDDDDDDDETSLERVDDAIDEPLDESKDEASKHLCIQGPNWQFSIMSR